LKTSIPDIKAKALAFSHKWADATDEASGGKKAWANDAERVAFLFGLYEQATSLLSTLQAKKPRRKHG
jgi:hypothetical protein